MSSHVNIKNIVGSQDMYYFCALNYLLVKQKYFFPTFSTLLFSLISLGAQDRVTAVMYENPPQIDGIINEEVWMKSEPVTEFFPSHAHQPV